MSRYLLYTILNYRTKYYLAMFRQFVKSMVMFSDLDFDVLIITTSEIKEALTKIKDLQKIRNVYFQLDDDVNDLEHALLRKCDIYKYRGALNYDVVLYVDIDVIVQGNIMSLFKKDIHHDIIYAPKEGSLEGKFWYTNAYKESELSDLRREHISSFNAGTFMFRPSRKMLQHFEELKKFAQSYKGKHFYDQSLFNYYFNTRRMSSTKFVSNAVIIFPNESRFYPTSKIFLHFAGIGRYTEKAKIMRAYLQKLQERRLNQ